eukprot:12321926-Alexandrium_andersonii.AAC.1
MEAASAAISRGPRCAQWGRRHRRSSQAAWQMRRRGPIARHRWVVWRPHSRQFLGGGPPGQTPQASRPGEGP